MSDEQTPDIVDPITKPAKPPKPPKKVKRGAVIYEPERSVRKTNIFRDRLIVLSGNVNLILAVCLFASAGLNAWIISQPNLPSPFYIQYTTGQIAGITLHSKEKLPPPQPLDILPLPQQARLDDAPVFSSGYAESDLASGSPIPAAQVPSAPSSGASTPAASTPAASTPAASTPAAQ